MLQIGGAAGHCRRLHSARTKEAGADRRNGRCVPDTLHGDDAVARGAMTMAQGAVSRTVLCLLLGRIISN